MSEKPLSLKCALVIIICIGTNDSQQDLFRPMMMSSVVLGDSFQEWITVLMVTLTFKCRFSSWKHCLVSHGEELPSVSLIFPGLYLPYDSFIPLPRAQGYNFMVYCFYMFCFISSGLEVGHGKCIWELWGSEVELSVNGMLSQEAWTLISPSC